MDYELDHSTPTGGFPPIFLCSINRKEEIKENKNREFAKVGTSLLSIQKIMEARKGIKSKFN